MPRSYSVDLRERVLDALKAGGERQAAVGKRFEVSKSTVSNWLKQERQDGRRQPKAHGGGRPLLGQDLEALGTLVREHNDLTLAEHAERLKERTGRLHSLAALCRALKREGWRRKKKPSIPASRSARMWRRDGRPGGPSNRGKTRSN